MRRRNLLIALGVLSLLMPGVVWLAPRTIYYLKRADYHARMEAFHRAKREEIRLRLLQDPRDEILEDREADEAEIASDHARLKRQYRRAAFFFWHRVPRDLPLPYPWNQERDRKVLEAALLQELDESYTDNRQRDHEPPLELVVVDQCASLEPEDVWGVGELLSEQGFPTEMVGDLERRNRQACESLAELQLDRRRIVVDDLRELHSDAIAKYPDAEAFGKVTLPGYSRDRKLALVLVQDFLNPHGSSGAVCVLVNSGARWRVLWSYRHGHE